MTSIALATVNGISTPQTASNPFTDTFSTQGSYANEAVSLTISSLATGQQVGLVARYNGSGLANMYYGSIMATSANTYTAFIYRIVNGVGTPLVSENYTGLAEHARERHTGIRRGWQLIAVVPGRFARRLRQRQHVCHGRRRHADFGRTGRRERFQC